MPFEQAYMQRKSAGRPASDSGGRKFKSEDGAGTERGSAGRYKKDGGDTPGRERNAGAFKGRSGSESARGGMSGGGRKPRQSEDGAGRPERKFSDRPARKFGDKPARPFRSREEGDDSRGSERPARKFGDKPARPFRSREEGDDSRGSERPARKFGDKPARPFRSREEGDDSRGSERPARKFGDKPAKSFRSDERNERSGHSGKRFDDAPRGNARGAGKKAGPGGKPFAGMPERRKSREDFKRENRISEREEFEKAQQDNDREYFGDDAKWTSVKDTRKQATTAASFPMPLNKYIAHSGECSRRDAAELVRQGKAKVNGELITDPGHKVNEGDLVSLSGKKLKPQKGLSYVLLNKPKGFITTNEDERGRRTVMDLVANADVGRIFPIGRLDRATTGLLLLTNDGNLTQKLSHPSFDVKKVYHVTLDKPLSKSDFEKIMAGLELEDGKAEVDEMAYLEEKNELGLEIHSGKNRIVRRIFESLGYVVEKLDRVMYAGLTKKNLPRGKWRYLNEEEIRILKHFKS